MVSAMPEEPQDLRNRKKKSMTAYPRPPRTENADLMAQPSTRLTGKALADYLLELYIFHCNRLSEMFHRETTYDAESMRFYSGEPCPRTGAKRANVWPRLAEFIKGLDADPNIYFASQFTGRLHPVLPSDMMTPAAAKLYKEFVPAKREMISHTAKSSTISLSTLYYDNKRSMPDLTDEQILEGVLMGPTCDLSALFRIVVAERANLQRIIDIFLEYAVAEYMQLRPLYDEVWGDFVPAVVKSAADAYAPDLNGGDTDELTERLFGLGTSDVDSPLIDFPT